MTITKQDPKTAVAKAWLPEGAVAGLGGGFAADGYHHCKSEFTRFAKDDKGRVSAWVTLTTEGSETIFAYVKLPKVGDKPGMARFFRRTLVAFGLKREVVEKYVGEDKDVKGIWFHEKDVDIYFFGPSEPGKKDHEIVYLLPEDVEDVKSGKTKITRSTGGTAKPEGRKADADEMDGGGDNGKATTTTAGGDDLDALLTE